MYTWGSTHTLLNLFMKKNDEIYDKLLLFWLKFFSLGTIYDIKTLACALAFDCMSIAGCLNYSLEMDYARVDSA